MEVVRSKRAVHIARAVGTIQPADIEGLAGTMQVAHIIGIAAVTGEAVTGIRPMDILGSAITAWAIAIHTTGLAITVTAPVGTIRMDITTPLTPTDTRCI
jgi:hypothetical protein